MPRSAAVRISGPDLITCSAPLPDLPNLELVSIPQPRGGVKWRIHSTRALRGCDGSHEADKADEKLIASPLEKGKADTLTELRSQLEKMRRVRRDGYWLDRCRNLPTS